MKAATIEVIVFLFIYFFLVWLCHCELDSEASVWVQWTPFSVYMIHFPASILIWVASEWVKGKVYSNNRLSEYFLLNWLWA